MSPEEIEGALILWQKGLPPSGWIIARGRPIERWSVTLDGSTFVTQSAGVVLLWALAWEIDQLGETTTGERVCARCSGRGEVLANANGEWPSTGLVRYQLDSGRPHMGSRAVSVQRCSCDGPTRPHTTALAPIVAQLASQRSPIVTEWPAQWLVDIDAMEANGWRDTWLPSKGPAPTVPIGLREFNSMPSWQCTWWRCFRDWATAGAVPGPDVLTPLLAKRTRARGVQWFDSVRHLATIPPTSIGFGERPTGLRTGEDW